MTTQAQAFDVLSTLYSRRDEAETLLRAVGFPEKHRPDFRNAYVFWDEVRSLIEQGICPDLTVDGLMIQALKNFPGNPTLKYYVKNLPPPGSDGAGCQEHGARHGHNPANAGRPPPTRVLFVGSNPPRTERINLADERAKIEKALLPAGPSVELRDVWGPDPNHLRDAILGLNPRFLHFGGHCDEDGNLYLHGGDGGAAVKLSALELGGILRTLKADPATKLTAVLLNACYSAKVEHAAIEADLVGIGWPRESYDSWQPFVTTIFYGALAVSRNLGAAIKMANTAIQEKMRQRRADGGPPPIDALIVARPKHVDLTKIFLIG